MRNFLTAVCLCAALFSCKRGAERPAALPGPQPEVAAEVPDTVFSSEPLPEAVVNRIMGVSYPENGAQVALDELRYLRLSYVGYDGDVRTGEMICNRLVADDLTDIFRKLYLAGYQIERMELVDVFGADDETSMRANNTSCFNDRNVKGQTTVSRHAFGMAVDVNPLQNPQVRTREVLPSAAVSYADRSRDFPHKISKEDLCYKLFRSHGFHWGGSWMRSKDYQHFYK